MTTYSTSITNTTEDESMSEAEFETLQNLHETLAKNGRMMEDILISLREINESAKRLASSWYPDSIYTIDVLESTIETQEMPMDSSATTRLQSLEIEEPSVLKTEAMSPLIEDNNMGLCLDLKGSSYTVPTQHIVSQTQDSQAEVLSSHFSIITVRDNDDHIVDEKVDHIVDVEAVESSFGILSNHQVSIFDVRTVCVCQNVSETFLYNFISHMVIPIQGIFWEVKTFSFLLIWFEKPPVVPPDASINAQKRLGGCSHEVCGISMKHLEYQIDLMHCWIIFEIYSLQYFNSLKVRHYLRTAYGILILRNMEMGATKFACMDWWIFQLRNGLIKALVFQRYMKYQTLLWVVNSICNLFSWLDKPPRPPDVTRSLGLYHVRQLAIEFKMMSCCYFDELDFIFTISIFLVEDHVVTLLKTVEFYVVWCLQEIQRWPVTSRAIAILCLGPHGVHITIIIVARGSNNLIISREQFSKLTECFLWSEVNLDSWLNDKSLLVTTIEIDMIITLAILDLRMGYKRWPSAFFNCLKMISDVSALNVTFKLSYIGYNDALFTAPGIPTVTCPNTSTSDAADWHTFHYQLLEASLSTVRRVRLSLFDICFLEIIRFVFHIISKVGLLICSAYKLRGVDFYGQIVLKTDMKRDSHLFTTDDPSRLSLFMFGPSIAFAYFRCDLSLLQLGSIVDENSNLQPVLIGALFYLAHTGTHHSCLHKGSSLVLVLVIHVEFETGIDNCLLKNNMPWDFELHWTPQAHAMLQGENHIQKIDNINSEIQGWHRFYSQLLLLAGKQSMTNEKVWYNLYQSLCARSPKTNCFELYFLLLIGIEGHFQSIKNVPDLHCESSATMGTLSVTKRDETLILKVFHLSGTSLRLGSRRYVKSFLLLGFALMLYFVFAFLVFSSPRPPETDLEDKVNLKGEVMIRT